MNIVPVEMARRDGVIAFRHAELGLDLEDASGAAPDGLPVNAVLGIRPEDLRLVPPNSGDLAGEIYVIEPSGREKLVDVQSGEKVFRVVAEPGFHGEIGDAVGLMLDRERLHLFDVKSDQRLL